ncbi:MAG: STAS domain-containing protein [Desulfosarcinaceae bacterium]|jgi:anti-anti-sigma factor
MNAARHPTAPAHVFTLPERLDALTADDVYKDVEKHLDAGTRHLTLDAGAMAYLSSKGVRMLLRMRKVFQKQGTVLHLANLQAFAHEVLTASGLGADLQVLEGDSTRVCL